MLDTYRSPNNYRYNLPTGEYCVTEDLSIQYPIVINGEVNLYSNTEHTISLANDYSSDASSSWMAMIVNTTNNKLILGGGAETLTINGEGQDLSYIVISQSDLELTNNCSIQNGSVSYGAVHITAGTFKMNGGTIENNTTTNTCSGIYTIGGTTNIVGGTIQNNYSNNTNNGASIYHNGGTLTVLGTTITTGTHYTKNIVNGEEEEVSNAIAIASWEELLANIEQLEDETVTTEFCLTQNLTATSTISVLVPIKITSNKEITITRDSTFNGAFFEHINLLEIYGSENAHIIFDGCSTSNITASYPVIVSSADLTLEYCKFQNNTNTGTDYDGGAIHGNASEDATICIKNCIFDNNSVTGSNMSGGAIGIDSIKTTSSFINTSFENNSAKACNGGAIYIKATTAESTQYTHTFTNCTLENNTASNYGGAIYLYQGSVIFDNINMRENTYTDYNEQTFQSDIYFYSAPYCYLTLKNKNIIENFYARFTSDDTPTIKLDDTFSTESSISFVFHAGSGASVDKGDKVITLEDGKTLTDDQINCFKSITDIDGYTYSLSPDGTLSAI